MAVSNPTESQIPKMGPEPTYRASATNDTVDSPKQPGLWQKILEAFRPDGTYGTYSDRPPAISGDIQYNGTRRAQEFFHGPDPNGQGAFYKGNWCQSGLFLGSRYGLVERFKQVPQLGTSGRTSKIQTVNVKLVATVDDTPVFIAREACILRSATLRMSTTDTITIMLTKCASGTAPASGTAMLSANLTTATTVNTNQNGSLSATAADYTMAAGDAIGINCSGALTTGVGVIVLVIESVAAVPNLDFILAGTNAADANVSLRTGGGITLVTAGANNDTMVVKARDSNSNESGWATTQWLTNKQVIWETILLTDSNIASLTLYAGLKLTATGTVATDDDQIYFRVARGASGTAYFHVIQSIGGTDTDTDLSASTDSAVAAAATLVASTEYHLRIEIDADRIATCYINGVKVYRSAALTSAVALKPFMGVEANTSAAKTVHFNGMALNRVY